jgi:hypothetical protein
MRPETSVSAWIPALHAGMTESRDSTLTDRNTSSLFFKGAHEGHEMGGFQTRPYISCFAFFVHFVVGIFLLRALRVLRGEICFFVYSFWLRSSRRWDLRGENRFFLFIARERSD